MQAASLCIKRGTVSSGLRELSWTISFFRMASAYEGGLLSLASPESVAIPELMVNVAHQMKCSE